MECRQAEIFKALSVTSRIRIIELLREKGTLGVKEMAEVLGITPSAVSQHLKALRHAGLVRNERKGNWLPYEIDHANMAQCKDLITEVCDCGCKGTCRAKETQPINIVDMLEGLRARARELQSELEEVEIRIKELEVNKEK